MFAFAVFSVNTPLAYESPVPAVVVAPLYTRPFASTPSPPAPSEESRSAELNVDDAVANRPFRKPTVVPVAV